MLWITAFTLSLILNQTAFANSSECGESLKNMIKSLKLNDDQKAKIKPILEQLKASKKDLGSQMNVIEAQIKQQENSTNIDQAVIDGLVEKDTKLIGDMIKAKIKAKNQILTILDDHQKKELLIMIDKKDKKMLEKYKHCHEEN